MDSQGDVSLPPVPEGVLESPGSPEAEPVAPVVVPAAPPRPYPGLAQSVGVMAVLLTVVTLLAAMIAGVDAWTGRKWIESAAVLGLINLISFSAVSSWVGRRMGAPVLTMLGEAPPAGTFAPGNVLLLVWAVAGQLMCAVGCVYAVGGKDVEKSKYVERLNSVMGPEQAWWVVVPLLVLVAPFTEEILFRGQFLRGFLARYSAPLAIGASAGLFSLMHLNPVQIPATLMLGILSGVLYERTRSVWPSIFAHMLNNSVPALGMMGSQAERRAAAQNFDPTVGAMLALIAAGLALWLGAIVSLRRSLPVGGSRDVERVEPLADAPGESGA